MEHREDSGTLPRFIYALSYIRQKHCRVVAFSRCFVIKGRMASFKIVSVDIAPNGSSGFLNVVILRQISFFILETAEPALNHDVVSPATLSIHALTDAVFSYEVNILLTCKLTSLIRVQNLWFCHNKCLFKSVDNHSGIKSSTSQPTIQRLYQSITAVRYRNPCLIGIYVMSIDHA